jgi:hypothetical protein
VTQFLDGPAAGQILMLRNAPIVLRVTCSPTGKWDALDAREDQAAPRERIFLYFLTEKPSWFHLRCSPRSASGTYWQSKYRYLEQQPDEHVMRDNFLWGAWWASNRYRLTPDWARGEVADG